MSLNFNEHMFNRQHADGATFKEKIDTLVMEINSHLNDTTPYQSTPKEPFILAVQLIELIPELFDKIAHGESGHRQWLNEAIENHFSKKPMPEYKAK